MRIPRLLLLAAITVLTPLSACSEPGPDGEASLASEVGSPGDPARQPELVRPADSEGSSPPATSGPRVVFLGTSLTEGLGLSRPSEEAWPARVAELAEAADLDIQVFNSGLSGETSAGAVRRLDWILQQTPDVLVVETGANDGLRALPVSQLESNLDSIVRRVLDEYPGTEIVLTQMEAPPNLGADYQEAFRAAYAAVAARWDVHLTPFLLEGVAGFESLNQGDGVHPTTEGHRLMAENAWPTIREAIDP